MEQKFYEFNDLVRADCHDCAGCSSCCRDMGNSIFLDPYDACQMQAGGGFTMAELLAKELVALTVWKGLILPCVQMEADTGDCVFLRGGRCGIHDYRPGICRLFPLGRNFSESGLTYFLLDGACDNRSRSKIRVSKWLGVQPAEAYHAFVLAWYDFRYEVLAALADAGEQRAKQVNMDFVKRFFLTPYDTEHDFYPQLYGRMEQMREAIQR